MGYGWDTDGSHGFLGPWRKELDLNTVVVQAINCNGRYDWLVHDGDAVFCSSSPILLFALISSYNCCSSFVSLLFVIPL